MTAPLRLHVRRSEISAASGLAVEIHLRLPSDVVWIEEAVELVSRHCFAGDSPTNRLRFRFRVALSEALANAIICGNCEDPSKQVEIRARCLTQEISVHVTDQGCGFDPTKIPESVNSDDLESPCGRGLFLIRNMMDQVRFNTQGNSICMTLRRH